MLVRLAEALGVQDLSELTGSHRIPVASITKAAVPGMELITAALIKPAGAHSSIPVAELVGRVDMAWQTWHQSRVERSPYARRARPTVRDGGDGQRSGRGGPSPPLDDGSVRCDGGCGG